MNTSGTSGQAKGGSGDVLSGILSGLCAVGMSTLNGAVVGAYLAGRASELAALEQSVYAALPSDTVACMGKAFLSLQKSAL